MAKITTDLISKILTTDVFTLGVVAKISITRCTSRCVVPTHHALIRQNSADICAVFKMRRVCYCHCLSRTSTEDVFSYPLTTVSQCHHKANAVKVLPSALLASISRIRIPVSSPTHNEWNQDTDTICTALKNLSFFLSKHKDHIKILVNLKSNLFSTPYSSNPYIIWLQI